VLKQPTSISKLKLIVSNFKDIPFPKFKETKLSSKITDIELVRNDYNNDSVVYLIRLLLLN
jgi:hypothetical protein